MTPVDALGITDRASRSVFHTAVRCDIADRGSAAILDRAAVADIPDRASAGILDTAFFRYIPDRRTASIFNSAVFQDIADGRTAAILDRAASRDIAGSSSAAVFDTLSNSTGRKLEYYSQQYQRSSHFRFLDLSISTVDPFEICGGVRKFRVELGRLIVIVLGFVDLASFLGQRGKIVACSCGGLTAYAAVVHRLCF